MYCYQCKKNVRTDKDVCPYCGTPFSDFSRRVDTPNKKPVSKLLIVVIIIAVITVLTAVLMPAAIKMSQEKDLKALETTNGLPDSFFQGGKMHIDKTGFTVN